MKITYFLRGLGAGIIFCTIVLFAASKTCTTKMSDEDVVKRAKQLGMVDAAQDSKVDDFFAKADAEKNNETDDSSEEKNTKTDSSTESEKKASATEKTEVTTQQGQTNTEDSQKTTEDAAKSSKTSTLQFTITSGMYSETVASNLESLGVVKDANAFNKYLCDYGYASRLVTGTYTFSPGEDYASIASKISR